MDKTPEKSKNFITKYLSKFEIFAWLLCIVSMLTIIFAQQFSTTILPYAWAGTFLGAGLIGWSWGAARKKK
jgi:ABC-type antimicrobial peptide transport system permease subunit